MNALLPTLADLGSFAIRVGGDKVQQVGGKAHSGLFRLRMERGLYLYGNVEQVCRIGSCHGAKIGQWTATAI